MTLDECFWSLFKVECLRIWMCCVVEEFFQNARKGLKVFDLTVLRPLGRKSVNQHSSINRHMKLGHLLTFLHKFSSSDSLSNLILVRQVRLARKCTMKPVPEVLIAKRILAS